MYKKGFSISNVYVYKKGLSISNVYVHQLRITTLGSTPTRTYVHAPICAPQVRTVADLWEVAHNNVLHAVPSTCSTFFLVML